MNNLDDLAQQLLTPERMARFRTVAAQRLACLTVVFEEIQDPHNVAACIRSAEAFGLARVHIVAKAPIELNNEVSASTHRWLEVVQHRRLADLVAQLRREGFTLAATVPDEAATPVDTFVLPPKVALLMGSERPGLSAAALAACDARLTIPMFGFADSLNLSTAAAILLDHLGAACRARHAPGTYLPEAEQQRLYRVWCARDVEAKTRGHIQPLAD